MQPRRQAVQPIQSNPQHKMTGSLGVIMSYDKHMNTASVAITESDSNIITDILRNVPCPVQLGVQSVCPEPGRSCWVSFKNGSLNQPVIINYYNHNYESYDYNKQNRAAVSIPSHLLD